MNAMHFMAVDEAKGSCLHQQVNRRYSGKIERSADAFWAATADLFPSKIENPRQCLLENRQDKNAGCGELKLWRDVHVWDSWLYRSPRRYPDNFEWVKASRVPRLQFSGSGMIQNGSLQIRRDVGKLSRLETILSNHLYMAQLGLDIHVGLPMEHPAPETPIPMSDDWERRCRSQWNCREFSRASWRLIAEGDQFNSDTDSEVIVHLIEKYLSSNLCLTDATRKALARLKGAHGVVVLFTGEPNKIVAARSGHAGGVVIGFGADEMFVASDLPAILEHTRRRAFLKSVNWPS